MCPAVNVYKTAGFRGCHSFTDNDMANVMLNHPDYCYYNPVVGMQNTSDESDEATTSHSSERVPSRFGAAAGANLIGWLCSLSV